MPANTKSLGNLFADKEDPFYKLDNTVVEYHSVCPDSSMGVQADFSKAFQCTGRTEDIWMQQVNQNKTKFQKAKRCLQGRMDRLLAYDDETDADYSEESEENVEDDEDDELDFCDDDDDDNYR